MNLSRWRKFSKRDQWGAIAAEVARAAGWKGNNEEHYESALVRAMELAAASLDEPRWRNDALMLLSLHEELGQIYSGKKNNIQKLYAAL